MIHELPLERRTVHGRWSRDLAPVLTIDPGDSVRFETLSIFWWCARGEPFAERAPDDGHALTGPIEVRGARAGATLSVRIDGLTQAFTCGDSGGRRFVRSCLLPLRQGA